MYTPDCWYIYMTVATQALAERFLFLKKKPPPALISHGGL